MNKINFLIAVVVSFALVMSIFIIVSCAPEGDDDEEELDCNLGECQVQETADNCPTFEVSCSDDKVRACRTVKADGRGCCMSQEELEALLCE